MMRAFRDSPSDFRLPTVEPTLADIQALLARLAAETPLPMPNPHHEPQVPTTQRAGATVAGVLLGLVEREPSPGVLLTRRHARIRFGGHISFPGGRAEPAENAHQAALRESHEEIGLEPSNVRVLGTLGDYYTHHGYCITPVVGVVGRDVALTPREGEVDEIIEVPLAHFTRSDSYRLRERSREPYRANFSVQYGEHYIGGPTLSILMNFYRMLAESVD
ncbi:MAG: CoA pyrophosphatase [Gammaproteobacteria bacterium]